jgi:hypothetical protein
MLYRALQQFTEHTVKIALALWIASILLSAGGNQRQHQVRWIAPASIAQERFQAGPLSLELRIQHAPRSEGRDSNWLDSDFPVMEIGLNTAFAASFAPFTIRIVLVLHLGNDPPETAAPLLLPPNSNGPPNRESHC